jgi:hypothetical protein
MTQGTWVLTMIYLLNNGNVLMLPHQIFHNPQVCESRKAMEEKEWGVKMTCVFISTHEL